LALGHLAQQFLGGQYLTKNIDRKFEEKNTYLCKAILEIIFTLGSSTYNMYSFVCTIIEIAKLTPKVLGHLAQQSFLLQK
jgi:hypothetical protein